MKSDLNVSLALLIFISLITIFFSAYGRVSQPLVLGSSTSSARIYDDNNGIIYIEYNSPLDVYNSLSSWQGKYPGRTINSSISLGTLSTKYSAVIFTYLGR